MGSLLVAYEHSLRIFSFNDIKIMCDLIKIAKNSKKGSIPPIDISLEFANSTMYTTKSRVNFRKNDY